MMSEMVQCKRHGFFATELGLKSRIVRRQFQAGLANNMENLAIQYGVSLVPGRIGSMEVVTSNSALQMKLKIY